MAELPPLPPGFKLDSQDTPPLPEGFTLDSPSASPRSAYDARYGGLDPLDRPPMLPEEKSPEESQPSPAPSPFRGVQRYFSSVDDAFGRLNRAQPSGGVGTIEALTTLGTGGIAAPILGTAESIALGTPPEESFARYTYQPRTESGKAQLGVLGALASPITESGLDVALGPLVAGESRILSAGPAKIRPNARYPSPRRDPVPAQPGAMDSAPTARPAGVADEVQAGRPAGPARLSSESVPTKERLGELADEAYKRADEAGVVVTENSLKGLKARVVATTKKSGIDKDLHPDSTAALNKILKSKGELTLTELETLRKVANDARGALKPADKRIAGQIVDELTDYIDNLKDADIVAGDATKAKALKEARALYTRKSKAETLERLVQRAKDSAPNYSASGLENAIRTEFRALAKNDKKMRLFTKEEQAAIRRVAQGGPMENAMRFIGKFAPTGVVSGTLAGGFATTMMGPAGLGVPVAGLAGRYAATRMTMKNVRKADELVRRGPAGANALAAQKAEKRRNALADF